MAVAHPAPFLAETVASLLQQTVETSADYVIVLDGARQSELPHLAELPPERTTVVEVPKGGLAAALNSGLALCEHRLVMRMDADDLAFPRRFELQLHRFLSSPPGLAILGSAAISIDEHRRVTGDLKSRAGDVRQDLLARNQVIHPSVMFDRLKVGAAGGYDSTMSRVEDYDLWLRSVAFGRIENVPEALIAYRVHSAQASRSVIPAAAKERLRHRRMAAARYLDLGYASSALRTLVFELSLLAYGTRVGLLVRSIRYRTR